jgi:hypothetical protein
MLFEIALSLIGLAMVFAIYALVIVLWREVDRQQQRPIQLQPKQPKAPNHSTSNTQGASYAPVTPGSQQYQKKPTQPTKQIPPIKTPPSESAIPLQPLVKKVPAIPVAKSLYEGVSSKTSLKLIQLSGHDRNRAERLVKKVQIDNPDRQTQWCWEKAIFDLERDRR